MKGWIKVHRQLIDSRVFANESLLKVWMYCLLKANHKADHFPITAGKGEIEVEVQPGQFVFGRNVAAHELKMNSSSVYKRMKKLEKLKNINIESNNQYSIVTICNWEFYQKPDNTKEHQKEHVSNNQVTTKEQLSNTYKNDKNDKNDKNKTYKSSSHSTVPEEIISGKGKKKQPSFEEQYDWFIKLFNNISKSETNGRWERQFRGDAKSKRQLKARIKEGYTSQDIEKAIRKMYRDEFHKNSNYKHATPELVTRSDKLEKFMNQ